MKKKVCIIMASLILMSFSNISLAGQWMKDAKGARYRNDDGSNPVNTWQWIDSNGDGIAECYYFGSDGYCYINSFTPDGKIVDANGAWVVNGIPQLLPVSPK